MSLLRLTGIKRIGVALACCTMILSARAESVFDVGTLLKLTPEQKASVQGGSVVVRGILTSVGMNYCTLQDPQSFAVLTCGYDPKNRAEFYNSRPGQMTTIAGIPYSTATGALSLSESRLYVPSEAPPQSVEPFNPLPSSSAIPISVHETAINAPPGSTESNLATIDPIALERAAARVAMQENGGLSAAPPPVPTPMTIKTSSTPSTVDIIRPTTVVPPPAGYSGGGGVASTVSPITSVKGSDKEKAKETSNPSGAPDFVRRVTPRQEAQGQSVAVGFGGSLFQTSDSTASVPGISGMPGYNSLDTKNNPGFMTSARYSRTWLMGADPQTSRIIPVTEGEFLYTGHRYKGDISNTVGGSAEVRTEMDIFAFMINGLAKFKMSPFYPYVGGGIGLGYVTTSGGKVMDNNGTMVHLNDSDEPAFAVQGIAGVEYVLFDRWSLFGEYKYLHLNDFDMNWGAVQPIFSDMDLHLFQCGVRHYF